MLIRVAQTLAYLIAALALVLGLLMIASAPAGAATWSEPQRLSAEHSFITPIALRVTGVGQPVAVWEEGDLVGGEVTVSPVRYAVGPPGGGAFSPARPLPADTSDVVVYSQDRMAALVASGRRVAVVNGTTRAGFGEPVKVSSAVRVARARIAANRDGLVAVAWIDDRQSFDRLLVSVRRPGKGFSGTVELARGGLRGVSVAVGPAGHIAVAYNTRDEVRARVLSAGGSIFGRAQTISTRAAFRADLRTVVDGRGRVVVGWLSQFLSEGGGIGIPSVDVALRGSGKPRFRAPVRLHTGSNARRVEGFDLELTGNSRVVAGWTAYDGANLRVQALASDRAGAFSGTAQTLSRPGRDAQLTDVAAGDTSAMVLWHDDGFPERNRVEAALATDTGAFTFAEPEFASPDQGAFSGRGAFLPNQSAITLFANRPSGTGPPTVAQVTQGTLPE